MFVFWLLREIVVAVCCTGVAVGVGVLVGVGWTVGVGVGWTVCVTVNVDELLLDAYFPPGWFPTNWAPIVNVPTAGGVYNTDEIPLALVTAVPTFWEPT